MPKLLAGRRAFCAGPLAKAPCSQLVLGSALESRMEVRCSPVLPTYPICRVVLRATCCSTDRVHCRALGMKPPVYLLALGETEELVSGVTASIERLVLMPMTNGALRARFSAMPTSSR